jgi:hypothetical protein
VYADSVAPAPGYVAHGQIPSGDRGYIYRALAPEEVQAAREQGWTLSLRARFYRPWGVPLGPDPAEQLGFGVVTPEGDARVGLACERETADGPYALRVALYGGDAPQVTPGLGEPGALHPTYMDYTLRWEPSDESAAGRLTLTVTDAWTGEHLSHTLVSTLTDPGTLRDADGTTLLVGDGTTLPAAIYIGAPENLTAGGHAYVDAVRFSIIPEPSTLMLLLILAALAANRRRSRLPQNKGV